MEEDQRRFAAAMADLAAQNGIAEADSPAGTHAALRARAEAGRAAEARAEDLSARIAGARAALRDTRVRLDGIAAQVEAMGRLFPPGTEVDTLDALRRAAARAQEVIGWRAERARLERAVPGDLGEPGMTALSQALILARRENARVYGLRVLDAGASEDERERTRATFEARCREAGVDGQLAFEEGDPVGRIVERARWADLVICNVAYPVTPGEPATLAKNVRPLLRRSPRPLLALPGVTSELERPLLAYDGGVRAQSALFVAVYMALRWELHPVVVSVGDPGGSASPLREARAMFERYGVTADYVAAEGPVAEALVRVADERDRDVILMGSHTWRRWVEEVFGGLLEEVLRTAGRPVLIS